MFWTYRDLIAALGSANQRRQGSHR